ncbi:MAG: hypothetical protein ACJ72N_09975 [Labedaea sp.]
MEIDADADANAGAPATATSIAVEAATIDHRTDVLIIIPISIIAWTDPRVRASPRYIRPATEASDGDLDAILPGQKITIDEQRIGDDPDIPVIDHRLSPRQVYRVDCTRAVVDKHPVSGAYQSCCRRTLGRYAGWSS